MSPEEGFYGLPGEELIEINREKKARMRKWKAKRMRIGNEFWLGRGSRRRINRNCLFGSFSRGFSN